MNKKILDINDIVKILPHRYPFLLVDYVTEIEVGNKISGTKNVTINEPYFTGHFPNIPVMPGVLIIEAMAQLSAILVLKSTTDISLNREMFLMSVENAKFRKLVLPGDVLKIHSSIKQNRGSVCKFEACVQVNESVIAESNFTAMLRDRK
ncbi:3-hydroxyacyl-ACP dehydratase FabZ [Rickettsia endosymbiont of Cardiosporidium cionae]|uniref:3-hydroxyacyl-ACP dehydratase FabZ n=1 Tax=Rickettsia endosymbiont of Cardiosporidium cionae TaxID=2777155 RepID=UPI0018960CF2|nr:3-hydroxyacyl-ACP dehydratase FabZ [Rickettsia endosymbiont of Cardiosporidium cionae]KAF8818267.1 3-hydroxyacyl-[acyl-carrier-protein] dehydratase FabZ [Rickettsia endosymbiont of Cardiosporidium cionae]